MFGVVPKTLWERKIPADEKNRIPLGMRCLLIEHPDAARARSTPASANKEIGEVPRHLRHRERAGRRRRARRSSRARCAEAGFSAGDVDLVINTHLHFDHAGGNTRRGEDGASVLSFPERALRRAARRVGLGAPHQRAHRRRATSRTTSIPVQAAGRLELVDDDASSLAGHLAAPHAGTHAASSGHPRRVGRRAAVLPRRPRADRGARAAAVDHGLRRRAARHARDASAASGPRRSSEEWTVMFEHDATHAFGRIVATGRATRCDGELRRVA